MEKIANIVTTEKKPSYSPIFNVVGKYSDIIQGIPTLIIGWENAKCIIPNADILVKNYNSLSWTFSKTERRCDYEDDLLRFYDMAIIQAMAKIKYVYVDIVKFRFNSIKKIIKFLKDDSTKTVFLTKDSKFMFVYSQAYNTVFGISLTLCEYLGISKKKVITLVHNAEFIHDTSFINSNIRRVIGTNTHYILPLYEYFR